MPTQHKFEVYRGKDGELRSKLTKATGGPVLFPVNGLPRDLKSRDVKFYQRNVQAALATLIDVGDAKPEPIDKYKKMLAKIKAGARASKRS